MAQRAGAALGGHNDCQCCSYQYPYCQGSLAYISNPLPPECNGCFAAAPAGGYPCQPCVICAAPDCCCYPQQPPAYENQANLPPPCADAKHHPPPCEGAYPAPHEIASSCELCPPPKCAQSPPACKSCTAVQPPPSCVLTYLVVACFLALMFFCYIYMRYNAQEKKVCRKYKLW